MSDQSNTATFPTKTDYLFTILNLSFTLMALVLPFIFFSWSAFIAFLIFYTVTGLGMTAGYHRLFAHHSYSVPKWLEHIIAICGYLAIQRGPIFWVSMHRMHHKYSDVPGKDPHSPKEGWWHVHFGWIHHRRKDIWNKAFYRKYVPDLVNDRLYLWMDHERNDYLTYIMLAAVSFVVGGFVGWNGAFNTYNALCFLAWVALLNRVVLLHAFGLINSVCHMFGSRPFEAHGKDESTNNFFVALIIFGEGWHHNHHTFPSSARHGLKWHQIDVAWYTIWLMKKLGIAKKVLLPSASAIDKKRKKTGLKNPKPVIYEKSGARERIPA